MYTFIMIDENKARRDDIRKRLSCLAGLLSCIGEADNGAGCIRLLEKVSPDFVILNHQAAIVDGLPLVPYLSETYPHMPLVYFQELKDISAQKELKKALEQTFCMLKQQTETPSSPAEALRETQYYEQDIRSLQGLLSHQTANLPVLHSKKLDFIHDGSPYLLLTLELDTPHGADIVDRFLGEHPPNSPVIFLPSLMNRQTGHLMFEGYGKDGELLLQARQFGETLVPWLQNKKIQTVMGISNPHSGLGELRDAYLETVLALDSRPLLSNDLWDASHASALFPIFWNRQEEFLFRLETGSMQEVFALSDDLFYYYTMLPDCTLSAVKTHALQISRQALKLLDAYPLLNQSVKTLPALREDMEQIFSLGRLKIYLQQFFVQISAALMQVNVYRELDLAIQVKTYLKRSYQKNLTLDFIALLFHLPTPRLCQQFQEQTGQRLMDYLNQMRIQRAKELLISSDFRMFQIARKSGFENVKLFFRIFREYENMTPEQYKVKAALQRS